MKINTYRPDIDGLRAIAVTMVVIFHFFPDYFSGGFVGVDIFFVISGFLITGIILKDLEKNAFSFRSFYARRIRRLFPSLLTVLLFCIGYGYFYLIPADYEKLGKHTIGGLTFLANFTLWTESGYFDIFAEKNSLLHLWSLGVEEQFYLVWPVLLLLISWISKKLILPILFMFVIGSFTLNIFFINTKPDIVFYFPFTRFWEIFIGAFLCVGSRFGNIYVPDKWQSECCSLAGLICIIFAALVVNRNTFFPGWWGLLPTIGAALIIFSGENASFNRHILSNKHMVWLGLISYPLYLWHWPLFSFASIAASSSPGSEPLSFIARICIIILSVFLAWFSYKFIEQQSKTFTLSTTVRISLTTAFLILVCSSLVFTSGGFSDRFSRNNNLPVSLAPLLKVEFSSNISQEWRENECFLTRGQGAENFSNNCLDSNQDEYVILWGDSHAAALYPGLRLLSDTADFGVGQFTASACPPVLNWNGKINPQCSDINDHILKTIEEKMPTTVILHAYWLWSEYEWQKIEDTLEALKKIGVPNIVLLGIAPSWNKSVPNVILSYFQNFNKFPPEYTNFQLKTNQVANSDFYLREIAEEYDVTFISLVNLLCNQEGCRLYINNNIQDVTSLDSGHLSTSASKFVMESITNQITF